MGEERTAFGMLVDALALLPQMFGLLGPAVAVVFGMWALNGLAGRDD